MMLEEFIKTRGIPLQKGLTLPAQRRPRSWQYP
jgi:hypothetical protein